MLADRLLGRQERTVSFWVILQAILPVYLMVGVGFAMRVFKVVTPEMERGMLKMIIHCLYPCLILDKVLGNSLVQQPEVLFSGVGMGFGLVMSGMFLAFGFGRLMGLKAGTGRRTFCVTAGTQNFGYIAVPLLTELFVRQNGNDEVLGVLFVHSLGVDIALWVFGVMIMTGSFFGNPKAIVNGPTVAVVVGVLLSTTGLSGFFEASGGGVLGGSVRQGMFWLGACAFPMGLVVIGATMYDLIGKEKISPKIATGSLLIRIVLMPMVFILVANSLPIVTELKQVLVVQASMPAAVTPIILARHYGGSPGVAVQVVIVTSVVALVTMPLWISRGVLIVFG